MKRKTIICHKASMHMTAASSLVMEGFLRLGLTLSEDGAQDFVTTQYERLAEKVCAEAHAASCEVTGLGEVDVMAEGTEEEVAAIFDMAKTSILHWAQVLTEKFESIPEIGIE